MTDLIKTTTYSLKSAATLVQEPRIRTLAAQAGQFIWHFVQMLLAMGAGMAIFHLLEKLIPSSSSLAAIADSETLLHTIVMDIFMTVPMVAWMIVRGHGWGHSVEMAIAMLAPMAVVTLLCQLGLEVYLPWLVNASSAAMFIGMLLAMLYRRDHYTGKANHSAHGENLGGEKVCH